MRWVALRRGGVWTLAVLTGGAMVACIGHDRYNPGAPVGNFHVTGKLAVATCGAGAPNPWTFDVRLRHEANTIYWVQGSAPIAGQLDGQTARAVLRSESPVVLAQPDPKRRTPGCVIVREDLLDVVLASGATVTTDPTHATSFSGALSYRYTVGADSDCSTELVAAGGGFSTLPCEVRYDIQAEKTADEPANTPTGG